ncbi:DUF1911 domain-containing protein [Iodobacter sp. HSC-16F04]|uniref:DUF1911 domain-containing protein n=1 Tax=Iodobacter violaceini TaxID=3044271 RepID=A0ABX0KQA7_9NEIS|nr:PoNi-like cognate immunity protein [Iodobacter violacea]NHQ86765.1 DUF1911 domain-containing protein [Iodobacter violacea]
MTFNKNRRQRFISEDHYQEFMAGLLYMIRTSEEELKHAESLRPAARQSFKWSIASEKLELFILNYTAGQSIQTSSADFIGIIDAFDDFIKNEIKKNGVAESLEITQIEAYVYVMWLLSLAKLLGHEEQIPRIMGWINKNAEFNRHRDGLFEYIVQKLTPETGPIERTLLHADVYRPLAKVIVSPAEERPALVKAFLDGWYKKMKDCYWYGSHTDEVGHSSYFGYWAFEAALVTFLWDVDDSSYRDHLYYPKDLIDFARSRTEQPSPENDLGPQRVVANKPCPQSGYWYTPAKQNSRVLFKQGELMPDFPGSTYGATIWYWDAEQD